MASNGHISFQTQYSPFNAELFPTTNPDIYWDFVLAPFWSDVDLRLAGMASWEIHTTAASQSLIDQVSTFIQENNGVSDFSGSWMMITYWEDVHPFPHGFGISTPYTLSVCIKITGSATSHIIILSLPTEQHLPSHFNYRWDQIIRGVYVQMWRDGVGG